LYSPFPDDLFEAVGCGLLGQKQQLTNQPIKTRLFHFRALAVANDWPAEKLAAPCSWQEVTIHE
jgi:hypothetical protein